MARFVISYARSDGKEKVKQFFDELSAAFFRIRPEFGPNPGYMDLEGNRLGSDWPEVLGGELRTAPILVPLYSPSYFASEECGRETQAFLLRLEDHGRRHPQGPSPRCILPAAWIRKRLTVPALLGDIHYEMPKPPAEYASYGLERLLSVQDLLPRFQEFVRDFACEISDALDQLPHVSPLASLDYRATGSAWTAAPAAAAPPGTPGTAVVQFGYIAATAAELQAVRRAAAAYGSDPRDWKVFLPPLDHSVGRIANVIVVEEGFHYEPLPFDDRLLERIAAAEAQHKIVALVVDSWVTRLPNYRRLLSEFDRHNFGNCTVLIPLNTADPETRAEREALLRDVASVLPSYADRRPDSPYFRAGISNYEEFDSHLRKALAAIRASIFGGTRGTGGTALPGY